MRLKKKFTLLAGFFLSVILLTGCAGPSMVRPGGDNALLISNLIQNLFIIAAIVFIVVESLLLFAVFRYSRKNAPAARQTEGNTPLEIGWTLFPAVVLAITFVLTLSTLQAVTSQAAAAARFTSEQPPVTIRVIGHQWWWEFRYPELGIITANEIHIPVNTLVNLDIETADVIHSFWVTQLAGKTDAIPGKVNKSWLRATQTGTFFGQCAEFCGIQHAVMRFNVIVDTPEQYQAWVQQQKAATPELTGEARAGSEIFQKAGCGSCHMINDTSWQGVAGPNLTHLNSRGIIAGGVMENTPENLALWIANPQAVKPGNLMPNLELSPENVQSILNFLKVLN